MCDFENFTAQPSVELPQIIDIGCCPFSMMRSKLKEGKHLNYDFRSCYMLKMHQIESLMQNLLSYNTVIEANRFRFMPELLRYINHVLENLLDHFNHKISIMDLEINAKEFCYYVNGVKSGTLSSYLSISNKRTLTMRLIKVIEFTYLFCVSQDVTLTMNKFGILIPEIKLLKRKTGRLTLINETIIFTSGISTLHLRHPDIYFFKNMAVSYVTGNHVKLAIYDKLSYISVSGAFNPYLLHQISRSSLVMSIASSRVFDFLGINLNIYSSLLYEHECFFLLKPLKYFKDGQMMPQFVRSCHMSAICSPDFKDNYNQLSDWFPLVNVHRILRIRATTVDNFLNTLTLADISVIISEDVKGIFINKLETPTKENLSILLMQHAECRNFNDLLDHVINKNVRDRVRSDLFKCKVISSKLPTYRSCLICDQWLYYTTVDDQFKINDQEASSIKLINSSIYFPLFRYNHYYDEAIMRASKLTRQYNSPDNYTVHNFICHDASTSYDTQYSSWKGIKEAEAWYQSKLQAESFVMNNTQHSNHS